MPGAPGSLFEAGAGLVESGAASARSVGEQKVQREATAAKGIEAGNAELGADVRQLSAQDAQKKRDEQDGDFPGMNCPG